MASSSDPYAAVNRKKCIDYRVRLKKMTQHLKCDYSVMPENFCAKFCTLVQQGAVH